MAFFVVIPAVGSGLAALGAAISTGVAAIGSTVAGLAGFTATGTLATAIGAGTISGTITAIKGGSVEDVLKSAVIGGATSYFGSTIGSEIAGSVTMSGATLAADLGYADLASSLFSTSEQIIKSALTSSFGAVLTGDDPVDALIKGGLAGGVSSGVSSAVDSVLEDIPGLDEIRGNQAGSAVERALKTSIANSIISGEDFDKSFIESLTGSGANFLLNAVDSTFKDFGNNLIEDSELVKNSKEQVDGLIDREKDIVTTINEYVEQQYQPAIDAVQDNESAQNYWAEQANSFIPTLRGLESRANSVTAMANEMNGQYGFNHWAVQKNPSRFLTDRAGGTYGKYYFGVEEYLVESEADGSFYSYPASRIVVVNNDTGARLYDYQQLINDVNANAAYINNTFPSVKSQFDNAVNNLNNTKAEYSDLVAYYNNAKETYDGYVNELKQVRNDYDAEVKELNSNVTDYQNTLQNFVKAEAENTQKINKLVSDLPQVISSFEADYGVKPTDQQLADLVTSGNGDISTGYASFDVNNVSEKEAEAFLGELGYTPTEDEIKQFIGQVTEDAAKANIAGYVDPRQVTEAEAIQVLTDLGVDPESEYAKDLIAEYTRQGDETQLTSQLTAGADTFIRTPKTVGDLLKLATNPVAYVLSPISGEISKLVTGAITNAVGTDNLDTQTKALIKTASSAVVTGAFAELFGGDFKKAALGTVVGTALNALPIPGTKDLFEGAKKDLTFNQIVDRISTSALSAAGLDVDSKFGTRIVEGTNSAIRAGLIASVAGGNEKQILINTGTAFLGGAFGNTKLSKDVSKTLDTFDNELTADAFDENGILKGLDPVDKIVVQGKSDTDEGIEEAIGIVGGLALMNRFTKDDVAPVSGGGGGGGGPSVTVTATRESCAADGMGFDETTNQCVDLVDVIGSGGSGQDSVGGGQNTVGDGSGQNTSVTVTATRESCAADGMGFDETTKECMYIGDFTGGGGGQGSVGGGGGQDTVGGGQDTVSGGSVEVTSCGPGKTRDPETGLCLETVKEDEECPPGQVDTGFGCQDITAAPCDAGFHEENGLCVADTKEDTECPEGQVRNLNTGLCEAVQPDPCPAGYKRNAAGECEIEVKYQPLPSFFGIDNLLRNRGGGAGYSPNLREKFTAVRTYTPPPEDYDYFKDDYFQRFGPISYVPPENYAGDGKAEGGLMSLAKGGRTSLPPRYLDGHSDGMADKVPASIDNSRPAALSDGEFVIPADVVSHLGNGNSNAGAKVLYEMMDRIRRARTGNSKQGKQINPSKFIPR